MRPRSHFTPVPHVEELVRKALQLFDRLLGRAEASHGPAPPRSGFAGADAAPGYSPDRLSGGPASTGGGGVQGVNGGTLGRGMGRRRASSGALTSGKRGLPVLCFMPWLRPCHATQHLQRVSLQVPASDVCLLALWRRFHGVDLLCVTALFAHRSCMLRAQRQIPACALVGKSQNLATNPGRQRRPVQCAGLRQRRRPAQRRPVGKRLSRRWARTGRPARQPARRRAVGGALGGDAARARLPGGPAGGAPDVRVGQRSNLGWHTGRDLRLCAQH